MHKVGIIALVLVAALGALPARVQASQFTVVAQVSPTTVPNGGTATLSVHTRIGADCVVSVLYDDGSAAPGLPGQHVGQSGIVKWQWAVHTSASGGTAAAACTSKGATAIGQARFSVGAGTSPEPTTGSNGAIVLGTYDGDNTTKPDFVGAFVAPKHFTYKGSITITFTGTQVDPTKNASGSAVVQADVKDTISLTDQIAIAPGDTRTQTVKATISADRNDCRFGCTIGIVEPKNMKWHIVVTR